jgi:hypothetical protein
MIISTSTILFLILAITAIAVSIYIIVSDETEKETTDYKVANWVVAGQDVPTSTGTGTSYGNLMYSYDGISWQSSKIGVSFTVEGREAAYGTYNGTDPLWVAVGENENESNYRNIIYSENGIVWKESLSGASFTDYGRGVAYGTSNGTSPLWVAVGYDTNDRKNILYSENGKVWQESTGSIFSIEGNKVAYGTSNGASPLWVAVGYDTNDRKNILYSENGKVWQESTGSSFRTYGEGIAYGLSSDGGQLWVAVGDDIPGGTSFGNIMYSENGKEWTVTSSGASFSKTGNGVAYGTSNGTSSLWVAVGDNGGGYGNIMYSENGSIWRESNNQGASFVGPAYDVSYKSYNGKPIWVATGDNNTKLSNVLYSTDGKTWQESLGNEGFSYGGWGVGSDEPLVKAKIRPEPPTPPAPVINWLAVGDGENKQIYYSSDGQNWGLIENENPFGQTNSKGNNGAYGKFIPTIDIWSAVGSGEKTNIYSNDGHTWTEGTGVSFGSSQGIDIAYGLSSNGTVGIWVAVGEGTENNILYSTTGSSWQITTGLSFTNNGTGNGVDYGLSSDNTTGVWSAVGTGGDGNILYSLDGQSWQAGIGLDFTIKGNDVAYGLMEDTSTPVWSAVGQGDNNILYSTDGQSWQAATGVNFGAGQGNAVAYGLSSDNTTGVWAAVGENNVILYSLDGQSWQAATGDNFGTGGVGKGIAYGMSSDRETSIWSAFGQGTNNFLYSLDGQSWQRTGPTVGALLDYGVVSNITNPAFRNSAKRFYLPDFPPSIPPIAGEGGL